jgi:putative transposase
MSTKPGALPIELANEIFEFIEIFYNQKCRHSENGYISPVEFEVKMQELPA